MGDDYPKNHFDKHGLLFACKVLLLGAVLIVGTKVTAEYLIQEYYIPSLESSTASVQKSIPDAALPVTSSSTPTTHTHSNRMAISRTIPAGTIASHIPETGKFIGADLTAMKLYLYEDGQLVHELPIISKGRVGSQWETPSGMYEVLTKENKHFSSIGHVYMPYSMQFYGNFFIHGWPYYPDGTPVSTGYSGGCIRMANEDAKIVYDFSELNTPLYVYDVSGSTATSVKDVRSVDLPQVSAQSYFVADIDNGDVFVEKNSDKIYPIASLTKLTTAMVANEVISFDKMLTVTQKAVDTFSDAGHLEVGEKYSVEQLLYPLLMESSNDAAVVLSRWYGESNFKARMNQKARAIEMSNTHFEDSSGISPDNTSSVYDLYLEIKYIADKKPFIFKVTRTPSKQLTVGTTTHTWSNFNIFSGDPTFIGGKTGHTTAAEDTMISLFNVPINGEKHRIVFIVLKSDNKQKDIQELRDWLTAATIGEGTTTIQ